MNTHEAVRHLCRRAADALQAGKADVALRLCAAAKAIHAFERERGLSFAMNRIDATGVWFVKP